MSEPPKSPQAMDVDEMPETGLPAIGILIQTTKNEVKEEEESPAPPSKPTMPDAGLPGEGNGAMSAGGPWQNVGTDAPVPDAGWPEKAGSETVQVVHGRTWLHLSRVALAIGACKTTLLKPRQWRASTL